MEKLSRKLLLGDLYNIEEYEEYFAEMSRNGLHLEKVGKVFAYFKEGQRRHLNYRIDMYVRGKKNESKIKKLEGRGWEFICEREPFLIFASPQASGPRELYERPEEQGLAIKKAREKSIGRSSTNILFIIGFGLFLILAFYMKAKTYRSLILTLSRDLSFLSLGLSIVPIFTKLRQTRTLKGLEKELSNGRFLEHEGDYLLLRAKSLLRNILLLLIILALSSTLIYRMTRNDSLPLKLAEDQGTIPLLTIQDIEESLINKGFSLSHNESDHSNILYRDWSMFLPKDYSLVESASLLNGEGEPVEYEVFLNVDYYLTRFDFIADRLARDILDGYLANYKPKIRIISQGKDFISYGSKTQDNIVILAKKGKQLMQVNYYNGSLSLEALSEIVINKLKANE